MTSSPADRAWLERWLAERVAALTGRQVDQVRPDRPLEEYGLSSRTAVALSGELEQLLDRALPATLVWECPTIAAIASALAQPEPAARKPDVTSARLAPEAAPTPANARAAANPPAGEPIAVVGIGCRFPGAGDGPRRYWEFLLARGDAVGEAPPQRWAPFHDGAAATEAVLARTTRRGAFLPDIAGFDAEFFGVTPREAALMDPQQRMILEVGWQALEHAAIGPESLRASATGVFVGASSAEYAQLTGADLSRIEAWTGTGAAMSVIAGRLSYALDLRGPSMTVDTACSSSLVATHLAVVALRAGECDLALAGGVNLLLSPAVTVNFDQAGTMAADGRCKTFDAAADGYVRGEGAGLVVLKRLSDARRDQDRVLAVILGGAVNSDGRSNGLMAPNPAAQRDLLRMACQRAGVDPREVDYVEAHGTGTLLGDPIEAAALGQVLGAGRPAGDPLLIGSAKTNLGHLEAAAGIAGLIKVVLALSHRRVPASRNFSTPNPHIPFADLRLRVAANATPWPRRDRPACAGVSSFGFGGANAHLVLAADDTSGIEPSAEADGMPLVFPLASVGPDRVADQAKALTEHLAGARERIVLADLSWTMARRAAGGRARAAVVARHHAGLRTGLLALAAGEAAPQVVGPVTSAHGAGAPVFVFSGQGSQWAGMGAGLLAEDAAFAATVARLDPLFVAEVGFPLSAALASGEESSAVSWVQPVLYGTQVALAATWRARGVEPAAVIGHSMGEVAAAVVAGALDEAAGLRVIATRSRLAGTLADAGGAMAALDVSAAEAQRLTERHPGVEVAVYAAPAQTIVAGPLERVRALLAQVAAAGHSARLVKVDFASHTAAVEPLLDELVARLGGLRPRAAAIAWLSTALADPAEPPVADAAYWARNLRAPVRLASAVTAAARAGRRVFVEISPHPLLTRAVAETLAHAGVAEPIVLPTLRRQADESATLLTSLTTLHAVGAAAPDSRWPGVPVTGRQVELPTTRWRHVRHWFDAAPGAAGRRAAPAPPAKAGAEAEAEPDQPGQPSQGEETPPAWAGVDALRALPADAARSRVAERLRVRVAEVMGYPPARLGPHTPLTELGLDSLMAARIANAVAHDFGLALPTPPLLRGACLAETADRVAGMLGLADPAPAGTDGADGAAGAIPAARPAAAITPRDAAERLVAGAWAQVVGEAPASVTVPLTAAGGPARLRRLAEIVVERAGVPVEPAALLAATTVEGMAHLLRERSACAAPVRTLRPASSAGRTPLFLFHPAGGDTTVYRQLAELLSPDQPVYGLERLDGAREVAARAARYVRLITERQPRGPYRLGGWSFGGFLAYESARQLAAAGERVEAVALIDSIAPLPPPRLSEREIVTLRFQQFAQYLRETYGVELDLPYQRLPDLDEEGQIDAVLAALAATGVVEGTAGRAILAHQKTSYLDLRMVERYAPATPHPGPVTLFRAAIPHPAIRDSRYQRHDATLGWDEIAGPGLRVVTVPGHHLSVLDPPHVSVLARYLDELLRGGADQVTAGQVIRAATGSAGDGEAAR